MNLPKRKTVRATLFVAVAGVLAAAAVFAANAAMFPSNGGQPHNGENTSAAMIEPQHPFRISGPNTAPENLAGAPGLEDLRPETDLATIRREMPATRLLAPADLATFKVTAAEGRRNSQGFGSVTYYRDDVQRRFLSIGAWNKVGEFNLVAILDSPVLEARLTTIDGLPALTRLPTSKVIGGLGPRTVYLYREGIIYAIHGEGFLSDDSFMSVVHNFIVEVKNPTA